MDLMTEFVSASDDRREELFKEHPELFGDEEVVETLLVSRYILDEAAAVAEDVGADATELDLQPVAMPHVGEAFDQELRDLVQKYEAQLPPSVVMPAAHAAASEAMTRACAAPLASVLHHCIPFLRVSEVFQQCECVCRGWRSVTDPRPAGFATPARFEDAMARANALWIGTVQREFNEALRELVEEAGESLLRSRWRTIARVVSTPV